MTPRPRPWFHRLLGIPTGALVALSVVPLAASLAVLQDGALVVPVVALDLAIGLVAVLDWALVRGPLDVRREVDAVQAVGRPFVVTLTVRNRIARRLSVLLTDEAPGTATGLPASGTLPGLRSLEVAYRLEVDRRGRHDFGDVVVRVRSPLGLWLRQQRYEGADHVRVYPDFAQLRETGFRGRLSEERVPVRARRRPGGENEFQRLRPYVSGDPFRHIDWKASARSRDLITREFGQESNQNLIFLLDCGRTMSSRSGGLTAFDRALNAAILLGQVAGRHGDRVGLLAFDDQPRVWVPPRAGSRDASRLIRATYDLEPSLREPDYVGAFRHLARTVRRRSLVVLFTQVIDEVNADLATQLVQTLAGRHLPIAIWLRDEDVEAKLRATGSEIGPYVRAAAAHIAGWRERALEGLRRRGAFVLDVRQEDLTPGLLHRYLEIKARRLL